MKHPRKREMAFGEQFQILRSLHIIGVLAKVIQVEHSSRIFHIDFKTPQVMLQSQQIVNSADEIGNEVKKSFVVKNEEKMDYDYVLQMHRIIDYWSDKGANALKAEANRLDKLKKNI